MRGRVRASNPTPASAPPKPVFLGFRVLLLFPMRTRCRHRAKIHFVGRCARLGFRVNPFRRIGARSHALPSALQAFPSARRRSQLWSAPQAFPGAFGRGGTPQGCGGLHRAAGGLHRAAGDSTGLRGGSTRLRGGSRTFPDAAQAFPDAPRTRETVPRRSQALPDAPRR